ncbi:MAG: glycosyltransferase, partial [Terrimesophilobacter sp.]
DLADHVAQLQSSLDSSQYCVLLKTHQVAHKAAEGRPDLKQILVPNEIPANQILSITDTLITDYSSIYFDFLATGRPILFFAPDLADYEESRGLYLEPAEWPGPVNRTMADLQATLNDYLGGSAEHDDVSRRYSLAAKRFCPYDDGHATDRIIDIVFRGRTEGYRTLKEDTRKRESILLYLGGMARNGITTSGLNLLNLIDHEKFDVSVVYAQGDYNAVPATQKEINPAVRQFPRVGGMNGSKITQVRRHLDFRTGQMGLHDAEPRHTRLWDDEWVRCFGASRFDYVVDFSGYGPFWSVLLLHSPPAVRSIWLHNDLAADAHREINGLKPMLRSLTTVFRLYHRFDHLVSVSQSLANINQSSLAEFAEPGKFGWAVNTVDAQNIRADSNVDLREVTRDHRTGAYPEWVDPLLADDGITTFITVGRLSPEKNQARLIRAFTEVHAEYPKTRLLIVGSGPLQDSLERQVDDAGLRGDVIFTGHQSRPQAIMKASDCFVLSSDYEGQPMVILEALVVGLPVVSVAFGSRQYDVSGHGEYVVEQSDRGLAEGMIAFLKDDIPPAVFDAELYSHDAIREFYRAIGVADGHRGSEPVSDSANVVA